MADSKVEDMPYRPCVGIMLLNGKGEVFVGRRIDNTSEAWQMPQGGIDKGETVEKAALRELKEEIGTDKVEILRESKEWLRYNLPEDLIPKLWNGKYCGQEQKWLAMRFLGQYSDINIETEQPEFSEWKWINYQELPGIIVEFKRELYRSVIREFEDLIKSF